jgi:hypothetical protein
MSHWAAQYIGQRYKAGAQGPTEWDCLHFAHMVLSKHFDTTLNITGISGNVFSDLRSTSNFVLRLSENALRIAEPKAGALCVFYRRGFAFHCGVAIVADSRNGVLHCDEPLGVSFSPFDTISAIKKAEIRFFDVHSDSN